MVKTRFGGFVVINGVGTSAGPELMQSWWFRCTWNDQPTGSLRVV